MILCYKLVRVAGNFLLEYSYVATSSFVHTHKESSSSTEGIGELVHTLLASMLKNNEDTYILATTSFVVCA